MFFSSIVKALFFPAHPFQFAGEPWEICAGAGHFLGYIFFNNVINVSSEIYS